MEGVEISRARAVMMGRMEGGVMVDDNRVKIRWI